MSFQQGHALVIGVGRYRHVPRLDVPIATADSQAVAGVLTDSQFCGYPAQQVEHLFDQAATREGILDALAKLARRAGPDDTATIFYCGHGDYGTDGEYYLVSHDAQIEGDKVAACSGVSQASLAAALKEIQSKRLLVIFNTCHSGEISPTLGLEATLGDRSLPNATADALLSTGSGRVIITACREEQFSYIGRGSLSLFTQALVDALHGQGVAPRGGFISAFDLYTCLYESVREIVMQTYGREQEPELTVLKGVGPFAVALYRGATQTDLGLAEAPAELSPGAAVRQVPPERSQRLLQQIIQTGGVNLGQGNVVEVGGSLIGEQRVDTGGGAFIGGSVNTGGGAFVGRDQTITTTTTVSQGASLGQFTALLAQLRAGLPDAGLEPKIQQAIEGEVASLQAEAGDSQPSLPLIETRLKGIQSMLKSAAGAGAAANATAIGMVQVVQQALELARQLFR